MAARAAHSRSADFVAGTRMLNGLLQTITAADNQRKAGLNLGYNSLRRLPPGLVLALALVLNGNDLTGTRKGILAMKRGNASGGKVMRPRLDPKYTLYTPGLKMSDSSSRFFLPPLSS